MRIANRVSSIDAGRLTQRVKVKSEINALFDSLIRIFRRVQLRRFNGQRVQPYPHAFPVKPPERVLQRADAAQMSPIRLDPVGKDLQIIADFVVSCLSCQTQITKHGDDPPFSVEGAPVYRLLER